MVVLPAQQLRGSPSHSSLPFLPETGRSFTAIEISAVPQEGFFARPWHQHYSYPKHRFGLTHGPRSPSPHDASHQQELWIWMPWKARIKDSIFGRLLSRDSLLRRRAHGGSLLQTCAPNTLSFQVKYSHNIHIHHISKKCLTIHDFSKN